MSFLVYQMKEEPEDGSAIGDGVMPQIINMTSATMPIKEEPTNQPAAISQFIKYESIDPGAMPQFINTPIKEEFPNTSAGMPHKFIMAASVKMETSDRTGGMPQIVNVASMAAPIKEESTTPDGIPQMVNMANVATSSRDGSPNTPSGLPQIVKVASFAASTNESAHIVPHMINMTTVPKGGYSILPGSMPQIINMATMASSSRDGSPVGMPPITNMATSSGEMPQIINMTRITAPSQDGSPSISGRVPQMVTMAGSTAPSESSASVKVVIPENEPPAPPPSAFASPAWYFFGVPGGSPNIQREVVVTCLLCQTEVRRGIRPGKLGTTCLYTHLERRHNLTREEICETAAAAGYCGPVIVPTVQSWRCSNDGNGLVLVPVKRSGASSSEQSEGQPPKRQAKTVPSIPPGPSETSSVVVTSCVSGPSEVPDLVKGGTISATSCGPSETSTWVKVTPVPAISCRPLETSSRARGSSITAASCGPSETSSVVKGNSITSSVSGPSEVPDLVKGGNISATSCGPSETSTWVKFSPVPAISSRVRGSSITTTPCGPSETSSRIGGSSITAASCGPSEPPSLVKGNSITSSVSGPSEVPDLSETSCEPSKPSTRVKGSSISAASCEPRETATRIKVTPVPAISCPPLETSSRVRGGSITTTSYTPSETSSRVKDNSSTTTSSEQSRIKVTFGPSTSRRPSEVTDASITTSSFKSEVPPQFQDNAITRTSEVPGLVNDYSLTGRSFEISMFNTFSDPSETQQNNLSPFFDTSSKDASTAPSETSPLTKPQDMTSDLSRCQAVSSGPPETPKLSSKPLKPGRRQQPGWRKRAMSTLYRQALRDRLLSSVHMYCEVCHTLILSGERSQSSRDLALESHFSLKHPHMFNRLKRGAARDSRLGGLGPTSKVPADS